MSIYRLYLVLAVAIAILVVVGVVLILDLSADDTTVFINIVGSFVFAAFAVIIAIFAVIRTKNKEVDKSDWPTHEDRTGANVYTIPDFLARRIAKHEMKENQYVRLEGIIDPTLYTEAGEPIDIDQVLDRFPEEGFFLVGEPGAGKSSTLQYLERKLIQQYHATKHRWPLWIDLGKTSNPIDAEELLAHTWRESYLEGTVGKYISGGELWLLLDGLNEMPAEFRQSRTQSLRAFLEKQDPKIPVTITCRKDEYERVWIRYFKLPAVYLRHLDKERIIEFISKGKKPKLWEELGKVENNAVLEMARNPYKLKMLIDVFDEKEKRLPEDEELQSKYLEETYKKYREERQKKDKTAYLVSPWEELEGKLKQIALLMITDGDGLSMSSEIASSRIGEEALLDGINMNVLRREDDKIRFYHQSMHDYLVLDPLIQKVTKPRPFESVTKYREKLIEQLGKRGKNIGPAIDALVTVLNDSTANPTSVRRKATMALGEIAGSKAVNSLIDALHDQDLLIRDAAYKAIIRIGEGSVESLIAALYNKVAIIRQLAAEALGEIRAVDATTALIAILDDEDADVRRAAYEAIGQIHDRRATEPLISVLESGSKLARVGAIRALGYFDDPRADGALLAALTHIEPQVRLAASEALEDRLFEVPLVSHEETTGHPTARISSAPRALKGLVGTLNDPEIRRTTIEALGELRDTSVVPHLIPMLEDSHHHVRKAAAEALGKIGDKSTVEPLVIALTDSDPMVKRAAAEALGNIGDESAVQPLIIALDDYHDEVQLAIVQALGNIGSAEGVDPLLALLPQDPKDALIAASQTLAKTRGALSVEPLTHSPLEYVDMRVQRASVIALGKIGSERAVQQLIEVLQDEDIPVRSAAADALRAIGTPEALEALQ